MKLKALWEELNNYRPVCSCGKCTCRGVKELTSYHQMEYVMSILMGLNDFFSQIRGQLLLLDPLPQINKVLSLVSQEKKQRFVTLGSILGKLDTINDMAFLVHNDNSKKFTGNNANATGNRFPSVLHTS